MIGVAASTAASLGMSTPIAMAISTIYGVASVGVKGAVAVGAGLIEGGLALNSFLNDHIRSMKDSDNPTISRTGRVFEMVKFGFGVGWGTGVAIIAAGQLILGNNILATTWTIATAPINPVALTCAAMGAVYYGWNALSDEERTEIVEKLSAGLEIGVAFINSIIQFMMDACKKVFSSENLDELKKMVGKCAAQFGKTLSSITHKLSDAVFDTYTFIKKKSEDAYDATKEIAGHAYEAVADSAESVSTAIKEKFVSNVHLTTVDAPIPKKQTVKKKPANEETSDKSKVKRSGSRAKKLPES